MFWRARALLLSVIGLSIPVLVGVCAPRTAPAQTFDAHGPTVPPDGGDPADPLTLWSAFAPDPGWPGAALLAEYAHAPLVREVQEGDDVTYEPVLQDLAGVRLSVLAPVHRRVALGASFPVWLWVDGETAQGVATGDLDLWAPVYVVDPGGDGVAVAVVPSLRLPTGAKARYLGTSGVGFGADGVLGWRGGAVALAAEVGFGWEPPTGSADWPGGARGNAAASVGWLPIERLGIHAEARAALAFAGSGADSVEVLATVKHRPLEWLWWTAGIGHGLTTSPGVAPWRAFLGVGLPAGVGAARPVAPSGVRLRVTDTDGNPVRAAEVRVGERAPLWTDHLGEVTLPGSARSRRLRVEAAGYQGVEEDQVPEAGPDGPPTVALAREPVEVAIHVSAPGDPPPGVQVELTGPSDPGPPSVDGATWRWSVPPGDWRATVSAAGLGSQERALPIPATRSEPVVLDVALLSEAQNGGDLLVRVRDPLGDPVEGAAVRVAGARVGSTGPAGEMVLHGVPRGEQRVEVQVDTHLAPAGLEVHIGAATATADLGVGWLPGSVKVRALGPDGVVTDALLVFRGPESVPAVPLGRDGEALLRLRPGTWNVLVSSPMLGAQERRFEVTDEPGRLVSLVVVLQPAEMGGADLGVTVYDPDGGRVEGARVFLDGRPLGETTDLGEVHLVDLRPGPRQVRVEAEHFRVSERSVRVSRGAQAVDAVLRWEPGTVRVSAVGPDGGPVDALLGVSGPERRPALSLGPDGVEVFRLSAGAWELGLSSARYGMQTRALELAEDEDELVRADFALSPQARGGGTLAVAVTDPDGAPVADAEVRLDGQSLGRTSNQGLLVAHEVPPGARTVEIAAEAFAPVEDPVRIRGRVERSYPLQWAPGALQVVVRGPGGPVDALVGVAGPHPLPPVAVGADGTRVLGLAPGTWWVLASSPALGAQELQVTLPDSPVLTRLVFDLTPVSGGVAQLLVRVRDPEGVPIAGVEAAIGRKRVGVTSAGGNWLSGPLAPGELTLDLAPPPTHDGTRVELSLEEGSQERIVVLPWRPKEIEVEVLDPGGRPVAAQVWLDGPTVVAQQDILPGESARFALRPGEWTVYAGASDLSVARERVVISPDDRSRTVRLTLAPPKTTVGEASIDVSEPILFDLDRAALRAESVAVVAEVARVMLDHPEIRLLVVEGHTDDSGGEAYNQELSERRAEVVRRALVRRGVAPERLEARGFGSSRPVTPNVDEGSRAANRRVELLIEEQVPVEEER